MFDSWVAFNTFTTLTVGILCSVAVRAPRRRADAEARRYART